MDELDVAKYSKHVILITIGTSTLWVLYLLCQTVYLSIRRNHVDLTIKATIRQTPMHQITFDETKETGKRTKLFRIG